MRFRAFVVVGWAVLFLSQSENRAHADQAFWATDNSGLWTTSSNWSYLPAGGWNSPNELHDVLIDRGAADPVITVANNYPLIRSLVSNEALVLQGPLYITSKLSSPSSQLNGSFALDGGQLIVSGANTKLAVNGPTPRLVGNILVSSGAKLDWLSSTNLVAPEVGYFHVQVDGKTSLFDMSHVTSFSANSGDAGGVYIHVNIGTFDLSNVVNITGGGAGTFVGVNNYGLVKLDSLVSVNDNHGVFYSWSSGVISAPKLTSLQNSGLQVGDTGRMDIPLLSNVDGSSLGVAEGGQLALPLVTTYDGLDSDAAFTLNSGTLGLSNLTHFYGSTGPIGTVIDAVHAEVDLSSVVEFGGGRTTIQGSGTEDAQIRLNPATTTMTHVTIVNHGGLLTGGTIDLQSGSELKGSADLAVNVLNSAGIIAPGFETGNASLVIQGDLTQQAGGRTQLDLGTETESELFDHLQVTGVAQLGGVLELHQTTNFLPGIDDEFRVLDAAAVTGRFARTTGYMIDDQLQLATFVDSTGVTLRVVLTGDAMLDRTVDGADYIAWADHFLQTGQSYLQGDFNNDGIVDGVDYTVWSDHFLDSVGPSLTLSAVPEPSSLALAATGVLGLVAHAARRCRQRR